MALKLRKWDVVEELKTDEDMALYLEAAMEEAGDDAAFIAKVLGDIARARGMTQLNSPATPASAAKASTRHSPAKATPASPPFSRSSTPSA